MVDFTDLRKYDSELYLSTWTVTKVSLARIEKNVGIVIRVKIERARNAAVVGDLFPDLQELRKLQSTVSR